MKEKVYNVLEQELEDSCFKVLKDVFEDLEGVTVDENEIASHYKRKMGSKYESPDDGFPKFVIDIVSITSAIFQEKDFKFSLEEFVRANIFRILEIFISQRVDLPKSLDEVISEEIVLYYLQDKGIKLSKEEFFFICGYTHGSDLHKFSQGMRAVCSSEFSESTSVRSEVEDNGISSEKNDGETKSENNSYEDLDEVDINEIESEYEDSEQNNHQKLEEEENEKKEEAAASFDELYN